MPEPVPPVVRRLLARRGGARPSDGRKIGLVVQGGCMRGVFTAGALSALEELGLTRAFDAVYGSSAGAINAGYFLAGHMALGATIYHDDINNRSFIDFGRLLQGTALDVDFCFDEIVAQKKRLGLERILSSPSLFKIYVTSVRRHAAVAIPQRDLGSPAELLHLLKASAAMPLVYRRPLLHRGERVLDGGLLAPVPLLEALEDGMTDVLVLLSRPLSAPLAPPHPWLRRLLFAAIDRGALPELEAAWRAGQARYHRGLDLLRAARARPDEAHDGAHLAVVDLPEGLGVARWTTDRDRLVQAAAAGRRRALELFGVNGGREGSGEETYRASTRRPVSASPAASSL